MSENNESVVEQEALEDGDLTESRVYELGFHLDGELPQEEVKKAYQGIRDRITAVGKVIAEGEPTKVPLAYTISRQETTGRRDFDSAFFCWIAYEADGTGHDGILEFVKSQSNIVRFLDIRTTKDAAKHSAEMHELFAKAALEQPAPEEDVSEVELDAALKEAGV
jgi:ribosomal protein S6